MPENPLQDSILDSIASCDRICLALQRLGDAAYLPMNAAESSTILGAVAALRKVLDGAEAVAQHEATRWGL